MVDRRSGRARLIAALLGVLPAGALAVVVNIWTTGWAWPAAVGVAVLLVVQVVVHRRQSAGTGDIVVSQDAGEVTDSEIRGARLAEPVDARVEVEQRFRDVKGSAVVGLEIGDVKPAGRPPKPQSG